MPRIRTIKPEFPHSENMGRISRDARLLFIELWTICDDSGRTRAASRMLASLLFPYDDDAPRLIEGWLAELEREHCITRYSADGNAYLQVCKWLNHQKIDRPSASKIPAFDESSRILANAHEPSSLDQGPRTKDQGREKSKSAAAEKPAASAYSPSARDKADLWAKWKSLPDGGGGAFLAKAVRDFRDEQRVLEAVERTLDHGPADPKAFLLGVLRGKAAISDPLATACGVVL